jgi:hypothetical protein
MLLPFIALFGLYLLVKAASKPRTSFNEFQWRRMFSKFQDLKHQIEYSATTIQLDQISDDILDFFSLYKFEQGIKSYTGELYSMIENRRVALRNARKIRA